MKQIIDIDGQTYVAEVELKIEPHYSFVGDDGRIFLSDSFIGTGVLGENIEFKFLEGTVYKLDGYVDMDIMNADEIKFFDKVFIIVTQSKYKTEDSARTYFSAEYFETRVD